MEILYSFVGLGIALVFGFVAGYFLSRILVSKRIASASNKAETMLNEARSKAQDLLLDSKNKAIKVLEDIEREEKDRRRQLVSIEQIVAKREGELDKKLLEIDKQKDLLSRKSDDIDKLRAEIETD